MVTAGSQTKKEPLYLQIIEECNHNQAAMKNRTYKMNSFEHGAMFLTTPDLEESN
jgi:hypothetical protein